MSFADFDPREYLRHIGVQYWEEGSPNVGRGWIGVRCIYCEDHHNHLGVNLVYKNFSCWKCKTSGSILELIQDIEDIGYGAALSRIDEFQALVPFEPEPRDRQPFPGPDLLPLGCGELTMGMRSYLRGRRHDPDALCATWGLLGGPLTGPWRYRIVIPVHFQGQVVTWIGMDTAGVCAPKYKAAATEESFVPTSELVYGSDHAGRNVVVVEGPTDVWRIGPGAVGLLGMGGTATKLDQLLALRAERYFIMLDGEPDAQRRAHRIAADLMLRGRSAEILELDSGDPDDLSDREVSALRSELMLPD